MKFYPYKLFMCNIVFNWIVYNIEARIYVFKQLIDLWKMICFNISGWLYDVSQIYLDRGRGLLYKISDTQVCYCCAFRINSGLFWSW